MVSRTRHASSYHSDVRPAWGDHSCFQRFPWDCVCRHSPRLTAAERLERNAISGQSVPASAVPAALMPYLLRIPGEPKLHARIPELWLCHRYARFSDVRSFHIVFADCDLASYLRSTPIPRVVRNVPILVVGRCGGGKACLPAVGEVRVRMQVSTQGLPAKRSRPVLRCLKFDKAFTANSGRLTAGKGGGWWLC